MACYAALLSLFHTLNNIKIHPRPPISLDQQQLQSLTRNLTFFQHFLESYPTYEDDDMERRIAAAAYAAEDVIETHIVDRIHAGSTSDDHGENMISSVDFSTSGHGENIGCVDFCKARWRVMNLIKKKVKKIMGAHSGEKLIPVDLYGSIERVIQEMDLIKTEVMQIIQHKIITPHLHTYSSGGPAASTWQSSTRPVFDDAMITQVLDKLTGQQSSLQIIPIVGMGGIGKTTFARNVYVNPLIAQYFDIRAWVTISQEYSRRNILQLLCEEVNVSSLNEMSEDDIGLILYQHLCGRRYLIVMDDIWSVEAWDKVKSFFPDNNDGSRIMMTTRLSSLAFHFNGCHVFQMQFLDEDKSWDLLSEIVFGKQDCPIELENIGKEIARKCGGLPLSVVVIGGLLRKSNMTRTYWIYTLENLSLLINVENNEYTLQLLRTSYKELPMHLKPCFLYMGIFPEDEEIKTSMLIRLWIAEGILRPVDDKSLEEVGKEYLKELIDRNLILIAKLGWDGEARLCKIHDLLRDVCLREAQKQKFFCLLNEQKNHAPQDVNEERRICINSENVDVQYSPEFLHAVESATLTRSLLYRLHTYFETLIVLPSLRFRLLRVFSPVDRLSSLATASSNAIFRQANMRYLSLVFGYLGAEAAPRLASLCSLLWNLQTLAVYGLNSPEVKSKIAFKIWEMPLLRHVNLELFALPVPPNVEQSFVLENLHTLKHVKNLKFSEKVVKRIPNVKQLRLIYRSEGLDEEELPDFCLHNLSRLQKLESLRIGFTRGHIDVEKVGRNWVSFPHSLRKLVLDGLRLRWEELMTTIGPLPLLQILQLYRNACVGDRWETIEGQFCSLKSLHIDCCTDLKYWETDSAHFPRLERLSLRDLKELEEIPWSIGDIPTLKCIKLERCSASASDSAKVIKEEQEENGNEDLQVVVIDRWDVEDREYYCSHEEDEEDEQDSSKEDQVVSDV